MGLRRGSGESWECLGRDCCNEGPPLPLRVVEGGGSSTECSPWSGGGKLETSSAIDGFTFAPTVTCCQMD